MITQKELKELVEYDPTTGWMIRLKTTSSKALKGGLVLSPNADGYYRLWHQGKHYYVHNLAWLYMTGELPPIGIDHVDGNTSDNRWCNLRLATKEQNGCNRGKNKNNTSGYKGVTKKGDKWIAQITIKGKHKYLGLFETAELAHEFYDLAAQMTQGDFYKPEPTVEPL